MSVSPKTVRRPVVIRRALALVVCALSIPYVFDRMDQTFVIPARLKRFVSVFGAETTIETARWHVRFGMAHQGAEAYDVRVTVSWRDERQREVGRNERDMRMYPGDTTFVSLTYVPGPGAGAAAASSIDYEARPIDAN